MVYSGFVWCGRVLWEKPWRSFHRSHSTNAVQYQVGSCCISCGSIVCWFTCCSGAHFGRARSKCLAVSSPLLQCVLLQSVYIVVVGRRWLNIFFYHTQGGQRNVSVISVTALTSKMYFRTTWIWWKSSSPRDICLPIYALPDGLVTTTAAAATTTTTIWI